MQITIWREYLIQLMKEQLEQRILKGVNLAQMRMGDIETVTNPYIILFQLTNLGLTSPVSD
jgi:hypothetical protein